MIFIKYIILALLFGVSTYIGNLRARNYINRVIDLKEMKKALNIFSTKIKFTYEPIPKIFKEITFKVNQNIGQVFLSSCNKMEELNMNAGEAWNKSLDENKYYNNFKKEDINVIKSLGNLLGKVDMEGQVSEIKLVDTLLNTQIDVAEEEKNKYTKMYKMMGVTIGLAIVVILI